MPLNDTHKSCLSGSPRLFQEQAEHEMMQIHYKNSKSNLPEFKMPGIMQMEEKMTDLACST